MSKNIVEYEIMLTKNQLVYSRLQSTQKQINSVYVTSSEEHLSTVFKEP
jgi:hypothetical protein